jgi:hypothetical protein
MENILDLAPPITAEELGEGLNMKKDDAMDERLSKRR